MESNEKQIIENLFSRLRQAETQSGPRDIAAETLIRNSVAAQPAAPYYMAQAILVQEHALQNLTNRVQELEQELAQRPAGGGFLGGLFGGAQNRRPGAANRPLAASQSGPAFGATAFPGANRGSFLGSALQTAAAVAGGVLLGNAIAGLFTEDAQAAEPVTEEPAASESQPAEEDFGGDEDSWL